MRVVTFNSVDHIICTTTEEVAEYYPNVNIRKYWEASVGDLVHCDNGYYAPLLDIRTMENKYVTLGNKVKPMKTPRVFKEFVFPKMCLKVEVRKGEIIKTKPCSYSTSKEERYGEQRAIANATGKRITASKMYFAWLLFHSIAPEIAITIVHGNLSKSHQRSRLAEYMTCPQTMYFLFNVLGYMSTLKQELEKQGITAQTIAEKIATYIGDEKTNVTLKKWAFETAVKSLEEVEKTQPISIGGSPSNEAYNAIEAIKSKMVAKAKQLQIPVQTH